MSKRKSAATANSKDAKKQKADKKQKESQPLVKLKETVNGLTETKAGFSVINGERALFSKDSSPSKAYANIDDLVVRRMVVSELQQNITDSTTELTGMLCDTLKVKCECHRDTIRAYTDKEGFFQKHLTHQIERQKRVLTVFQLIGATRKMIVKEIVVQEKDYVTLYTFQFGIDMLAGNLMQILVTTKGVNPAGRFLPYAGGHGVGLKQLMMLFAQRGWQFQICGTLPAPDEHVLARWVPTSPRFGSGEYGVWGSFTPRAEETWPQPVLEALGTRPLLQNGNFLCHICRFPNHADFSADDLFNIVRLSNVSFLPKNLSILVGHNVAILKNEIPGVSAFYLNGTPVHHDTSNPGLTVIALTKDIGDYTRVHRGGDTSLVAHHILRDVDHEFMGELLPTKALNEKDHGVFIDLLREAYQGKNPEMMSFIVWMSAWQLKRRIADMFEFDKLYSSRQLHGRLKDNLDRYKIVIPPALLKESRLAEWANQVQENEDYVFKYSDPQLLLHETLVKVAKTEPITWLEKEEKVFCHLLAVLQSFVRLIAPAFIDADNVFDLSTLTIRVCTNLEANDFTEYAYYGKDVVLSETCKKWPYKNELIVFAAALRKRLEKVPFDPDSNIFGQQHRLWILLTEIFVAALAPRASWNDKMTFAQDVCFKHFLRHGSLPDLLFAALRSYDDKPSDASLDPILV